MQTSQTTVTTTATKVLVKRSYPRSVLIHNESGAFFIGGSNAVTSLNGFKLDNKDKIQFELDANTEVWVITASGTAECFVLDTTSP